MTRKKRRPDVVISTPRTVVFKPAKFHNHVTITELSRIVNKEVSWLRQLEKDDRIPRAARVKAGKLEIRLWSPAQVEEVKDILSNMRVGRPPKDDGYGG
jgi:hypothetical protein